MNYYLNTEKKNRKYKEEEEEEFKPKYWNVIVVLSNLHCIKDVCTDLESTIIFVKLITNVPHEEQVYTLKKTTIQLSSPGIPVQDSWTISRIEVSGHLKTILFNNKQRLILKQILAEY